MEFLWQHNLICPLCGAKMERQGNSLFCGGVRRHCFDLSADGYVNLASPKASGGGDDGVLIAARTAFLEAGHYHPFAERIASLVRQYAPEGVWVDAGCGEGYYTNYLAAAGTKIYGFDLSKKGVRHGARAAARAQLSAFYAVSSVFELPLADAAADGIISLFAPVAEAEFLRVLKPGGLLLMAGAGAEHLLSLKRVLYDIPRPNEARGDLPQEMTLLEKETIRFNMDLNGQDVQNLFAMTPYFYRTSREGRERLATLDRLSCEAEMDIFVFQKN